MLAEQKRAGKIRHLGISILGKGSEFQAREARRFGAEVLQVVYNRLDRRPEQIYFPHAQRDRLGILARVPLASGLLSGKYRPGTTFAPNDVRATFDPERMRKDIGRGRTHPKGGSPAGGSNVAICPGLVSEKPVGNSGHSGLQGPRPSPRQRRGGGFGGGVAHRGDARRLKYGRARLARLSQKNLVTARVSPYRAATIIFDRDGSVRAGRIRPPASPE